MRWLGDGAITDICSDWFALLVEFPFLKRDKIKSEKGKEIRQNTSRRHVTKT
jgi:hypothetical protein